MTFAVEVIPIGVPTSNSVPFRTRQTTIRIVSRRMTVVLSAPNPRPVFLILIGVFVVTRRTVHLVPILINGYSPRAISLNPTPAHSKRLTRSSGATGRLTLIHILPALFFLLLAPLQFSQTSRDRHLQRHRRTGARTTHSSECAPYTLHMSDDSGDRAPAANGRIHAPEGGRNDVDEIFIHQPILFENLKELVLDIQWSSLCHVTQTSIPGGVFRLGLVAQTDTASSCRFVRHSRRELSPPDSEKMKTVSPSVTLAKSPGCSCSRYKKELSCLKHFSLSRS